MPISLRKIFILPFLVLVSLVMFSVVLGWVLSNIHTASVFAATTTNTPYVSAAGTNLYMHGEPYQFIGVNAFNLGTLPGSNIGCGGQVDDLDAFFSRLRPNSIVRLWAFQGTMATNVITKQTDWTGLDRVVSTAQKDGIKLMLVLGDQAGACDDGHWRDISWYSGGYTQAFNDNGSGMTPIPYLDYVKLIVSRYKDSTAIAMWEPLNEPEAATCQEGKGTACYAHQMCDESGASQALRSFFDSVGTTIKRIDTNHLVVSGVGGDGQCSAIYNDYQYIHESPGIDVASYHDYRHDTEAMPGDAWNGLQERLDQMKQVHKPLIIEEVGILGANNATGCASLYTRRDEFKGKMDAEFKAGIAGYMPWDLTQGTSANCNYDIADNDPMLTFLHDYPVQMSAFTDTSAPTAPTNLVASAISSTEVTLTWKPSVDNVGVVRYDIFANDRYATSTTGISVTITNLTPGTSNTYFVKGKDAEENNSNSSNEITAATLLAQ